MVSVLPISPFETLLTMADIVVTPFIAVGFSGLACRARGGPYSRRGGR